ISPTETQGPLEAVPRMKKYMVEAIYQLNMPEKELKTVYSSQKDVESFIRRRNVITEVEITVKDFDEAPEVAAQVRSSLPTYEVKDWIQMNKNLFFSLKLERVAMFVILAFIVIVASFNIVTTLTLMVLEKKKEIAILKAM